MSEASVTIKLSGSEYRTLCAELEYHEVALKELFNSIKSGPDKRTAMQRLARFQTVREKVAS